MTQRIATACRRSPTRRPKAKTRATETTSICQIVSALERGDGFS